MRQARPGAFESAEPAFFIPQSKGYGHPFDFVRAPRLRCIERSLTRGRRRSTFGAAVEIHRGLKRDFAS